MALYADVAEARNRCARPAPTCPRLPGLVPATTPATDWNTSFRITTAAARALAAAVSAIATKATLRCFDPENPTITTGVREIRRRTFLTIVRRRASSVLPGR